MLPLRFQQKFVDHASGCWLWTACLTKNGYGRFSWDGKVRLAHRVAYELLVGPIPEGLEIDHLCRVRHCVNPDHLEPVTRRENIHRGFGITAVHARKTHCPKGHEYTEDNLLLSALDRGNRVCKTCLASRDGKAKYWASKPPEYIPLVDRTHCPHGHEYTPENTGHYKKAGTRYCRECGRIRGRARYHKNKGARNQVPQVIQD